MNAFDELLAEVMRDTDRFGHRQHLQLTWLAVRRYGVAASIDLVSEGIQRTARYAGAPQKYHVTISRAWVELVGHHLDQHVSHHLDQHVDHGSLAGEDFTAFAARCPDLLDKRLLGQYYRSTTLATDAARTGWLEPDLKPLPGRPSQTLTTDLTLGGDPG